MENVVYLSFGDDSKIFKIIFYDKMYFLSMQLSILIKPLKLVRNLGFCSV